jgi:hypothetical protein
MDRTKENEPVFGQQAVHSAGSAVGNIEWMYATQTTHINSIKEHTSEIIEPFFLAA